MQNVLSIDISSKTAEAVVVGIEGKNIQILERHSLEIGDFLATLNGSARHSVNGTGVDTGENKPSGDFTDVAFSPPEQNPIQEILAKVTVPWNNAILTVPAHDFLSLNMYLPFSDNRSINRIIDLEVQDLVPFDVADFHLCHKSIAVAPPEDGELDVRYDTHVGIIPKSHINKIMDLCHQANFEPHIVTTPSAAVGSVLALAPLYFAENSLILVERLPDLYAITCFDGLIRTEKIIRYPSFNGSGSDGNKSILMDLKLFVASNEKRYQKNLEKVYYFGGTISSADLQKGLARSIEVLKSSEFIPVKSEENSIAAMAAVYAEENYTSLIINNFRARQHAYNQKLKYLLRASKALLPLFGIFLASFIAYLAVKFMMNEYRISRLNSAINSQIRTALSETSITQGAELSTLQTENQKLEEQLNDISSLSSMTPLDLLLEVSKDLPSSLKISVKSVKIKDNKILVEGSAPEYKDVENIKKIFEKKPIYQRVKKNESSSVPGLPGTRPFSFEIWVKE